MSNLDPKAAQTAASALGGIPFGTLIGAPLQAAVEAQALAAKTSYEFIERVGLNAEYNEKGEVISREAVNVDFKYNRGGQEVTLNVPLITILQIPYFEINSMSIDFKAKISAEASTVQEEEASTTTDSHGRTRVRAGWGSFGARANFKASYSSKKDSYASSDSKYSVEYTMDIAVRAGQSDMPAGMATVLNILQGSIQEDSNYSRIKSFLADKIVIGNVMEIKGYVSHDGQIMVKDQFVYCKIIGDDHDAEINNYVADSEKIIFEEDSNKLKIELKKKETGIVVTPGMLKLQLGIDKEYNESIVVNVELVKEG